MQWIVGTIFINVPRTNDLDLRTIFCCDVMILFAHAVSQVAPTIYRKPAFGSPNRPHIVGFGWISRKKLCHSLPLQQQGPLPIPFCQWLHRPLAMLRRNARHYKSCTCVCAHCSSPLILQGKAIPYMASCKSSDTDNLIGCSVSPEGRDK